MFRIGLWSAAFFAMTACQCGPASLGDAGVEDGGTADSGVTPTDAGLADAGARDAGGPDAGALDAGCTIVHVLNVASSCRLRVDDGGLTSQPAVTLCVAPGEVALGAEARPGFQLGEHPWHGTDGDVDGGEAGLRAPFAMRPWAASTPMPIGRDRFGLAIGSPSGASRSFIYAVGGSNAGATALVHFAPVDEQGNVGTWLETAPLPFPLLAIEARIADGRIYVVGGWDGMGDHDEVFASTLNADGSLSPWSVAGRLPQPRNHGGLAIRGARLFVFAGANQGGWLDGTSAALDAGSLGAWSPLPALGSERIAFGLGDWGDWVALAGGTGGGSRVDDIAFARFQADGGLTAWSRAPLPWGEADQMVAAAHAGQLIIGAGYGLQGYRVDVRYAAFDAGLTGWTSAPSLPSGRSDARAAVGGRFMYVVGGYRNAMLSDVLVSELEGQVSTARLTVGTDTACAWVCCESVIGATCPQSVACP